MAKATRDTHAEPFGAPPHRPIEGVVIPAGLPPDFDPREWIPVESAGKTASNDWERGFAFGVRMGYELRIKPANRGGATI